MPDIRGPNGETVSTDDIDSGGSDTDSTSDSTDSTSTSSGTAGGYIPGAPGSPDSTSGSDSDSGTSDSDSSSGGTTDTTDSDGGSVDENDIRNTISEESAGEIYTGGETATETEADSTSTSSGDSPLVEAPDGQTVDVGNNDFQEAGGGSGTPSRSTSDDGPLVSNMRASAPMDQPAGQTVNLTPEQRATILDEHFDPTGTQYGREDILIRQREGGDLFLTVSREAVRREAAKQVLMQVDDEGFTREDVVFHFDEDANLIAGLSPDSVRERRERERESFVEGVQYSDRKLFQAGAEAAESEAEGIAYSDASLFKAQSKQDWESFAEGVQYSDRGLIEAELESRVREDVNNQLGEGYDYDVKIRQSGNQYTAEVVNLRTPEQQAVDAATGGLYSEVSGFQDEVTADLRKRVGEASDSTIGALIEPNTPEAEAVAGWVGDLSATATESGSDVFDGLIEPKSPEAKAAAGWVSDVADTTVATLEGAPQNVSNVGNGVVEGLTEPRTPEADAAAGWVSDVAEAGVETGENVGTAATIVPRAALTAGREISERDLDREAIAGAATVGVLAPEPISSGVGASTLIGLGLLTGAGYAVNEFRNLDDEQQREALDVASRAAVTASPLGTAAAASELGVEDSPNQAEIQVGEDIRTFAPEIGAGATQDTTEISPEGAAATDVTEVPVSEDIGGAEQGEISADEDLIAQTSVIVDTPSESGFPQGPTLPGAGIEEPSVTDEDTGDTHVVRDFPTGGSAVVGNETGGVTVEDVTEPEVTDEDTGDVSPEVGSGSEAVPRAFSTFDGDVDSFAREDAAAFGFNRSWADAIGVTRPTLGAPGVAASAGATPTATATPAAVALAADPTATEQPYEYQVDEPFEHPAPYEFAFPTQTGRKLRSLRPDSDPSPSADGMDFGTGGLPDADDGLQPGWFARTVSTIGVAGTLPVGSPSQSTLEGESWWNQLTGELPTNLQVSGSAEVQESIEDVEGLFSFGGVDV